MLAWTWLLVPVGKWRLPHLPYFRLRGASKILYREEEREGGECIHLPACEAVDILNKGKTKENDGSSSTILVLYFIQFHGRKVDSCRLPLQNAAGVG
jgi:hypothetical protein